MKIAVFDHVGNWGGGSRFVRALLLNLKKEYPSVQITFFGKKHSLIREGMVKEFEKAQINVKYLFSTSYFSEIINRISLKVRNRFSWLSIICPQIKLHKEIVALAKGYDLAFFPWPYFIECPNLDCPIVGVFHDFNYKYFFGTMGFSDDQCQLINRQFNEWLLRATPIVSSRFIASELEKFYPTAVDKVEIVHLAPFDISEISEGDAKKIVKDLGIKNSFILYPTNLSTHKNIGILLHSIYLLCKKNMSLTLVITGPGTERATGTISEHGVEKETLNPNVVGLGYVSNLQMDALIKCAKVVISTSLYEAGNGAGLEAWGRGVPVIMSNIPSFVEHIEVLGVKATLVDPYDANNIAEKIYTVISNYDQAIIDAEISRNNISRHSWKKVARQYYEIFSKLVQEELS